MLLTVIKYVTSKKKKKKFYCAKKKKNMLSAVLFFIVGMTVSQVVLCSSADQAHVDWFGLRE